MINHQKYESFEPHRNESGSNYVYIGYESSGQDDHIRSWFQLPMRFRNKALVGMEYMSFVYRGAELC